MLKPDRKDGLPPAHESANFPTDGLENLQSIFRVLRIASAESLFSLNVNA